MLTLVKSAVTIAAIGPDGVYRYWTWFAIADERYCRAVYAYNIGMRPTCSDTCFIIDRHLILWLAN